MKANSTRTDKLNTIRGIKTGRLSIHELKPPQVFHFWKEIESLYYQCCTAEGKQLLFTAHQFETWKVSRGPRDKVILHIEQAGNDPLDELINSQA